VFKTGINWRLILWFFEILPWVVTFTVIFTFIFIASPSSADASVGKTFLRILPPIISAIASISFFVYCSTGTRHAYYKISDGVRTVLDFERSLLSGAGLLVLFSYVAWLPIKFIFNNAFKD
jgi:hypothetical protein